MARTIFWRVVGHKAKRPPPAEADGGLFYFAGELGRGSAQASKSALNAFCKAYLWGVEGIHQSGVSDPVIDP
jgi:hypothetical protein